MPVLPLVESSRIFPGASWPARCASATMRAAARSLTEPPGLYHSALPKRFIWGESATSASSGSRGVLPIAVRTASPRGARVASGGKGAELKEVAVIGVVFLCSDTHQRYWEQYS